MKTLQSVCRPTPVRMTRLACPHAHTCVTQLETDTKGLNMQLRQWTLFERRTAFLRRVVHADWLHTISLATLELAHSGSP